MSPLVMKQCSKHPGSNRRDRGRDRTAEHRSVRDHARLTMAKGTMPTKSFWLMKTSDTARSVVPFRGYSTCQVMGWVPERLLKLAISKFICTTSWNEPLLLEGSKGRQLLAGCVQGEDPSLSLALLLATGARM